MSKELFVSSTPHQTKVALVESDLLSEVYFERENEYTLAGSIYKGRVMPVLPGMQSAFVDIGLERDAFLYVSDFFDEEEEFERIVIDKAKKGTPDAEHAAAQQLAQDRVEREQRIDATHERVAPLLHEEEPVSAGRVEPSESGKRRGRRGK